MEVEQAQTNPPASDDDEAPKACLVAFIDLMGFKHALKTGDIERQKAIRAALREVAEQERNFLTQTFQVSENHQTITIHPAVTTFSDNVLISYDLEELDNAGGPYLALLAIRRLATALAHRAREFGCLVRGAVTIGDLYQKDRVSFGNGLVDAYELESNAAKTPRIIVTKPVMARLVGIAAADGNSTDDRALFLDDDGYWCLDYMTGYLETLGSDDTEYSCMIRRTWALGLRAKFLDTADGLAKAGNDKASANWSWFAERFEKSMLSINSYHFNRDGSALKFPEKP